MHCAIFLTLLLPFIGAHIPHDGDLKHILEQEIRELKGLVADLVLGLEVKEKSNLNFGRKLVSAENVLKQLADTHSVQRREFTESQVAFYAKLTTSLKGLSRHQSIIFDTIVTNTLSTYDKATGIFTALVTGMYVLSWTANVDNLNSQATELVIDGSAKAWAYADTAANGDGDYGSSSQTIVVKVTRGQHVWIRTGTRGNGAIHGNDYSTFSGFLLFPTN